MTSSSQLRLDGQPLLSAPEVEEVQEVAAKLFLVLIDRLAQQIASHLVLLQVLAVAIMIEDAVERGLKWIFGQDAGHL